MSMSTGSILMALLCLSSLLVMQCSAQETVFQWSFADNSSSAGIVPCQRARIAAHAFSRDLPSIGRPPYYMAAYPLDGSPTVTFVGMDPSDLSWEVNYPAGSQLMLALIDADGNSGGIMPSILTVADGGSSACLPPAISSFPSVTTNVTQDLAACEPLGLTIQGGTRPYTVSVVRIDSAVSNFTLGPRDDIFTWTNQASVDTDVLFAVSDVSGNWASHSAFFKATLSPSQCSRPAWRSFASDASGTSVSQSSRSKHRITVIVGACLGVAVAILLICLAILFLCLRRRGIMARRCMDGQDVIPRTWADERAITISRRTSKLDLDLTLDFADDAHSRATSPCTASVPVRVPSPVFKPHTFSGVLDISASNRPPSPAPSSAQSCAQSSAPADPPQRLVSSPISSCPTSPDVRPRPLPVPRVSSPPLSLASDAPHPPTRACTTPTSFSTRPLPSIPQPHPPLSRKAREALGTDARLRNVRSAGDVRRSATAPTLHRPRSLVFAQGAVRESWAQDGAGRELVVIQHRDGAVVQELPPPYDECLRSPSYPPSPSPSLSSPLYSPSHLHSHSRSYSQS